jgi:hypothetical protein
MTQETTNVGLTVTHETILKFPEFFDVAEASNAELAMNIYSFLLMIFLFVMSKTTITMMYITEKY